MGRSYYAIQGPALALMEEVVVLKSFLQWWRWSSTPPHENQHFSFTKRASLRPSRVICFTNQESFGSPYERFTFFVCRMRLGREILGTSKVSYKFQVTIPKDVRERFRLSAEDIVVFADDNGKLVMSKNTDT